MESISRRRFVQGAIASTARLTVGGSSVLASTPVKGWEPRRPVNPSIDNLRVVCGQ